MQATYNTKADVAAILKALAIGYVKASNGSYGASKVVLEGKRKGIAGGSIGPLTVTNAHIDHNVKVQKRVREAFETLQAKGAEVKVMDCYVGCSNQMIDLFITVPLSEKKVRVIKCKWDVFPTYTRAANLDPSYATYWYTVEVEDKNTADL